MICCCKTKGPAICPMHKDSKQLCESMGCTGKAADICDCGRWVCINCEKEHPFCYPGM